MGLGNYLMGSYINPPLVYCKNLGCLSGLCKIMFPPPSPQNPQIIMQVSVVLVVNYKSQITSEEQYSNHLLHGDVKTRNEDHTTLTV